MTHKIPFNLQHLLISSHHSLTTSFIRPNDTAKNITPQTPHPTLSPPRGFVLQAL